MQSNSTTCPLKRCQTPMQAYSVASDVPGQTHDPASVRPRPPHVAAFADRAADGSFAGRIEKLTGRLPGESPTHPDGAQSGGAGTVEAEGEVLRPPGLRRAAHPQSHHLRVELAALISMTIAWRGQAPPIQDLRTAVTVKFGHAMVAKCHLGVVNPDTEMDNEACGVASDVPGQTRDPASVRPRPPHVAAFDRHRDQGRELHPQMVALGMGGPSEPWWTEDFAPGLDRTRTPA